MSTITCVLLSLASAMAATGADGKLTQADVQHLLNDHVQSGTTVGMSAAIIEGDDVQYFNAGKCAYSSDKPVTESTIYEIGSITKVFTALLLADMANKAEVGLDDAIDGYFPNGITPPKRDGKSITLRNLAQHASSLPRLPGNLFNDANMLDPYAKYTSDKLFAFLDGYELPRAIGSGYEYSNLGVGLLGELLARRAHSDYPSLVRTRICDLLGMSDTSFEVPAASQDRVATGHVGVAEVPAWHMDALAGCGGLHSTCTDLVRFIRAQMNCNESPLCPAIRTCLDRTNEFATNSARTTVTLGWHVTETKSGTVYWHNGGTGGFRSFVGFDRERKRGVVVLSNSKSSVDDIGMTLVKGTQ
ncbi:MAG: beta-lactamase family protein [Phycisphaerales bacterium]|nr:beta-lactamase family protein [Phycisphaerales bacterium]